MSFLRSNDSIVKEKIGCGFSAFFSVSFFSFFPAEGKEKRD